MVDIVAFVDRSGTVKAMSPGYGFITGFSADHAIGSHLRILVHPDDVCTLLANIAEKRSATVTLRWRCHDPSWFETESELSLLVSAKQNEVWVLNSRELSQKFALEKESRQAQQLEALGRLTAGIAHEINTPIQFAGNNLHFLKTAFADLTELLQGYRAAVTDGELIEFLKAKEEELDVEFLEEQIPMAIHQSFDGIERVARIVRAMKTFGHPDATEQAAVDLNELVSSTVTVARNEWKYVATVEMDLGEIPEVTCFAGDVNQILLNVIVNAAHAIADKGASEGNLGTILVRTFVQDEYAVVTVSDSGCGIPDEIKGRIYDPFFTTKEVGRGTGQGLALVKSLLVDRHNGIISIDTKVGVGTTFEIRLPIEGAQTSSHEHVVGTA